MKVFFKQLFLSFCLLITLPGILMAAEIFTTDVVVQGSECIGHDCPDAPSFLFDTLLFMGNYLRIHFDDTSATESYPNNDSLTISANGNIGMGIMHAGARLQIQKSGLTAADTMLLVKNDALETLKLDGTAA